MARTGDTIIPLPTAATPAARREQRFLDTFNALPEPQQRVMEALLRVQDVTSDVIASPSRRRGALNAVNRTHLILTDLFASF